MPRISIPLNEVADELAANTDRADQLRLRYDDSALMRCPSANAWSAAQCIAHLKLTTEQYRIPIAELISRQKQRSRTSNDNVIRPGLFAGWFISQASPDGKRKLPAPKAFRVDAEAVSTDVFDQFKASQADLAQFIAPAQGLELNRGKLPSPVTRLIRFTLGEAFLLLVRHQARHLDQAETAAQSA